MFLLKERPNIEKAFPLCMDHKANKSRREAAALLFLEMGY